jgi:hypothetical protein
MPFTDPPRDVLDLTPFRNVAELPFGAELVRDGLEPLLSPRQEDAAPAVGRETPCDRSADPARSPGYDCDANTRNVSRLMATVSSIGSA